MGCIQPKKIVKIGTQSPKEGSKNGSNNLVVHNIKKEATNDNDNLKNNNSKNDTNAKTDDKMIHSNSQNFKIKIPINDNQSKSNYSKKNSSYFNHSVSNSEKSEIYKLAIEHKNDINLNNLIDKALKLEDKYEIIGEENYESFFQVYKIKLIDNSFSKEVFRSMIKIEKDIFGEYASDKKIAEEVSLLSQLDSRYIIKVYECFISDKKYYLITDNCPYGSLNEKLRNGNMYNESQIRYLVLQIFKAIKYLNTKNFLHIEISPEKILIYDITKDYHGEELYNIKLLDFFCPSRNNVLLDNKSSFFCYMAPEVIDQKYSPTCDIWSIGIVIFQMFFGELPHKENIDFKEYIKNIKSTYNHCGNISSELKDLLDKMLNKNPSRRITIDECLSHPWIHKQNTDIVTDEEEFNKQQQLIKTKTKQTRADKRRRKSYKSGRLSNIGSKNRVYNSEKNSYKTNLIEMPLHKTSSSFDSLSNSNYDLDSDNNNIKYKSLKADSQEDNKNTKESKLNENKFNEIKRERIKINSENNLSAINLKSSSKIFNKQKNNKHFKSENARKAYRTNKKSIKRMSSVSADENLEHKIDKKYPPLIEKTVFYIQYFIVINYHKIKETEKLTKIFNELDSKNNKYLPYNKVIYASMYYKENKIISLESFNNYDSHNIDNDKKYKLDEFINLLIEEKTKYINDNFRNVFESIRQPNIDEIIQIYKDQEPIDEYKKYVVYIKDCVKVIQENTFKKNYFYSEFITLINNSIKKLHPKFNTTTCNNTHKSAQNSSRPLKSTFTRNPKDKNRKTKSTLKRSNTFLKNIQKNSNSNTLRKAKEKRNHLSGKNFYFCPFNQENFLQLIKK
jgi:serine/threonine protein kinase